MNSENFRTWNYILFFTIVFLGFSSSYTQVIIEDTTIVNCKSFISIKKDTDSSQIWSIGKVIDGVNDGSSFKELIKLRILKNDLEILPISETSLIRNNSISPQKNDTLYGYLNKVFLSKLWIRADYIFQFDKNKAIKSYKVLLEAFKFYDYKEFQSISNLYGEILKKPSSNYLANRSIRYFKRKKYEKAYFYAKGYLLFYEEGIDQYYLDVLNIADFALKELNFSGELLPYTKWNKEIKNLLFKFKTSMQR